MLGFQVFIFHLATKMLKTSILFGRLTSLKFFLKNEIDVIRHQKVSGDLNTGHIFRI